MCEEIQCEYKSDKCHIYKTKKRNDTHLPHVSLFYEK